MATPRLNVRPDLPLAVVVGGGAMGLALARRLGERHFILLADRDEAHLARVADMMAVEGYDIATAICDVSDSAAVSALAAQAAGIGPVRVLAHAVGLSPSMADWRTIMSVNLIGATHVREAIAPLTEAGSAAVFIASIAAHSATPNANIVALLDAPLKPGFLDELEAAVGPEINTGLAYQYSKWALVRMCRQNAAAWGARGARIVSLSPGLIATPMGAAEFERQPSKKHLLAKTPLQRQGSVLEIADAVEFLTSDRASFITGIDLLVDGGVIAAMQFSAVQ